MRHPSLRLAPSPSFTNECTRICVESSRAIISLTDSLRKGNHYLDTTWYGATVQLVAILTILFSVWEKRETVKSDEIEQMKKDMEVCQDIMADLDNLLGLLSYAISSSLYIVSKLFIRCSEPAQNCGSPLDSRHNEAPLPAPRATTAFIFDAVGFPFNPPCADFRISPEWISPCSIGFASCQSSRERNRADSEIIRTVPGTDYYGSH